jgi:molybdate transport system permease protein
LLGLAFLVVPLAGLLIRAPWTTLGDQLFSEEVGQALLLSVVCASLATVLCLVLGVPLAWLLARGDLPGRGVLRASSRWRARCAVPTPGSRRRPRRSVPPAG